METETKLESNKLSIPMAIIIAGILIAGAILLKDTKSPLSGGIPANPNDLGSITVAPVTDKDAILGDPNAKVTVILYEDFQCPFCGATSGHNKPLIQSLKQRESTWTPFVPEIKEYAKKGDVLLVYRDWAFLGPESVQSALAARCAKDQGKFWEYHDFLYSNQNGENEGNFSDSNLKSFAKNLGLDTASFNQCFDSNKYIKEISDSKDEGITAGVKGTPKGYILKKGKVVGTIEGAESFTTVKPKIDAALK
jgi:protein-disulfide isomerase